MDRASDYGSEGCRFDSGRVRHFFTHSTRGVGPHVAVDDECKGSRSTPAEYATSLLIPRAVWLPSEPIKLVFGGLVVAMASNYS